MMDNNKENRIISTEARLSAKDPEFVSLAADYLDTYNRMNTLRNETQIINSIPKTMQLIIDKILEYHKSLIETEIELRSKGFSKKDVFRWEYEAIIK